MKTKNTLSLLFGIVASTLGVGFMVFDFYLFLKEYISNQSNIWYNVFLTGNFLHKLGELLIFMPLMLGVILIYTKWITYYLKYLKIIKLIILTGGIMNLVALLIYITQNNLKIGEFMFSWTIILFISSVLLNTKLLGKILKPKIKLT